MNQNTRFTFQGVSIWLICATFFLYEFLLRTVIGTFQHPIMSDLELTTFQFSILSSTVYLFIYSMMQIPVGLIVDRLGLKKSLLIGSIVCSASAIGFAYSYDYQTAIVFRILTGFGSSFGFICLLVAVYDWLPTKHIALLIGLSQFIGTMGPMIAAGPLESLSESGYINWRSVFIFLSIGGFFLSGFMTFFVKNNQSKTGTYTMLKRPENTKKTIKRIFSKARPSYISSFSALVYFSLEYLAENEGKIFLTLKDFSPTFAAYMITLSWLGYALGCPLMGWLSDHFKRRRPTLIFTSFSCSTAIICIVFAQHKLIIITAFFMLGIGASGQSVAFAIMAEQFKKAYLAAGLSFNNTLMTFLASINAPILGGIIDMSKSGSTSQLSDYTVAFTILVIIVSLSIIFPLFLIKETYCKPTADFVYLRVSSH